MGTRRVVTCLARLVTEFWTKKQGLKPREIHMGFVVEKVALEQVILQVLVFCPVSIIPQAKSFSRSFHSLS
jgi:hypothetical protein